MNPRVFWRKWHRWISFPSAIFLCFAAVTGVIVASTEFFGEAERLREKTRDLVSPVTAASPSEALATPLSAALAATAKSHPAAPIDKVVLQFKGERPTVEVFLGKPTGGEDRRLVYEAKTGVLLQNLEYADKPLWHRVHSGEFFGDGGLVVAMFWGTALAFLTVSGTVMYWQMRRRNATGVARFFW